MENLVKSKPSINERIKPNTNEWFCQQTKVARPYWVFRAENRNTSHIWIPVFETRPIFSDQDQIYKIKTKTETARPRPQLQSQDQDRCIRTSIRI